jgi:hypothetical protein
VKEKTEERKQVLNNPVLDDYKEDYEMGFEDISDKEKDSEESLQSDDEVDREISKLDIINLDDEDFYTSRNEERGV